MPQCMLCLFITWFFIKTNSIFPAVEFGIFLRRLELPATRLLIATLLPGPVFLCNHPVLTFSDSGTCSDSTLDYVYAGDTSSVTTAWACYMLDTDNTNVLPTPTVSRLIHLKRPTLTERLLNSALQLRLILVIVAPRLPLLQLMVLVAPLLLVRQLTLI